MVSVTKRMIYTKDKDNFKYLTVMWSFEDPKILKTIYCLIKDKPFKVYMRTVKDSYILTVIINTVYPASERIISDIDELINKEMVKDAKEALK